jgi:hypothetical protein
MAPREFNAALKQGQDARGRHPEPNDPRKHIGGAIVFNSLTFAVSFACVLLLHNLPFSWMCAESLLCRLPRDAGIGAT